MKSIAEERQFKIDRILEEFDRPRTQTEVAEMFGMEVKHVSWVAQRDDEACTRKIIRESSWLKESMLPPVYENEYEYLDQYPVDSFKK